MDLRWAYEVLEVIPGADRTRVHASYRELARRWHPDWQQADPARAWRGAERLRHVNAAYAAIRAAGFPAVPAAPTAPAWAAWTPTTWPHERVTPPPQPQAAASRSQPRASGARSQPRASTARAQPEEDVSVLWALLWLVLLVLTLGLLDGLGDAPLDD